MNEVLEFPSAAECEPEWQERPVSVIATHISNVYHEFTRDRLPFITSLATRVADDSWRTLDRRSCRLSTP